MMAFDSNIEEISRVHCRTHDVGWDPSKLIACWYEDGREHEVCKGDVPRVPKSSHSR